MARILGNLGIAQHKHWAFSLFGRFIKPPILKDTFTMQKVLVVLPAAQIYATASSNIHFPVSAATQTNKS